MKMKKLVAVMLGLGLLLAACDSTAQQRSGGENVTKEQDKVQTGFRHLANSQQIPAFDYSQVRQTLIDVETMQAQGTVSTTAFYLEGIGIVGWCPSIGAPVASTSQLSATQQYVDLPGDEERSLYPVDQGEPTGVYPGQSTGTWTICTDDNGRKFAHYWEGYVASDTGVIAYDSSKRIRPADVTFKFGEAPAAK